MRLLAAIRGGIDTTRDFQIIVPILVFRKFNVLQFLYLVAEFIVAQAFDISRIAMKVCLLYTSGSRIFRFQSGSALQSLAFLLLDLVIFPIV